MSSEIGFNPWLAIWVRPRETIRKIVDHNPKFRFIPLSMIYGFSTLLQLAETASLGEVMNPWLILLITLVLSPLYGMLMITISSGLLFWTGKWIKGKANYLQVRSAFAWSSVPLVLDIFFKLVTLGTFGDIVFISGVEGIEPIGAWQTLLIGTLFIVELVVLIWTLVILFIGLSEVQQFSIGKAVLNFVFMFVILFAAIFIINWVMSMIYLKANGM